MPERTVEAWRSLWFHTGDAGARRSRAIVLHRPNKILSGGAARTSRPSVEQVINGHPEVAESCVIGVRDEGAGGEEEMSCIVAAGNAPEYSSILDWCVERMPRYAVPRFLEYVSELDKTPTGKLRKQDLRDAGTSRQYMGPRKHSVVPR